MEHQVSDEPVVTYTVKDILARIESKLDAVTGALTGRLEKVEDRLGTLETELQHRQMTKDNRRWLVGSAATLVVAICAILALHPWG